VSTRFLRVYAEIEPRGASLIRSARPEARIVIDDLGDYRLRPDSPASGLGLANLAPDHDFDGKRRDCVRAPIFLRGDTNDDGARNLSDAVVVLSYLFNNGGVPSCLKSADTDDDSILRISDPIFFLNWLFIGGPAPAAPTESCGEDPSPDDLSCDSFASCATP